MYWTTEEIHDWGHTRATKQVYKCLGTRFYNENPEWHGALPRYSHAFFPVEGRPGLFKRLVSYWAQKIKCSLERFRSPVAPLQQPAQVYVRNQGETGPFGTEIWGAGSNRLIGVVDALYDSPSRFLAYPHGYRHDLALIMGDDLPKMVPPPNVNMKPQWMPCEEAMEGAPVFASALNFQYKRWRTLEGHVAARPGQKAVVQGMNYYFHESTQTSRAGLLRRMVEDSHTAKGWSGSVLCLGTPTEGRPLIFQNYQSFSGLASGPWPER